ncbi:Phosphoribosyl-ATP pyrophosphohydrolase [compost metagenome]
MTELADAKDSAQAADAVIDIIYIAAGTIDLLKDRNGEPGVDHQYVQKGRLRQLFNDLLHHYSALPLAALWEEVHSANMRKERGTEGTSKYGNKYDIVKPEGWVGPDIAKVLREASLNPDSAPLTYYRA